MALSSAGPTTRAGLHALRTLPADVVVNMIIATEASPVKLSTKERKELEDVSATAVAFTLKPH